MGSDPELMFWSFCLELNVFLESIFIVLFDLLFIEFDMDSFHGCAFI